MSDVLYRLQTHLPNDIIYHCILPLCPKFGITSNILKLQLKRIYLMKLIASDILIKNRDIKKDIFEKIITDVLNIDFKEIVFFLLSIFRKNNSVTIVVFILKHRAANCFVACPANCFVAGCC